MTTTSTKNMLIKGVCLVCTLSLVAGSAQAAEVVSDNWTVTDSSPNVMVDFGQSGVISATMTKELNPKNKEVTFVAGTLTESTGSFSGNYLAAGVTTVGFTLQSNQPIDAQTRLVLIGESERFWLRRNLVAGANSVALDRTNGGWDLPVSLQTGDLDQLWAEDLSSVKSLGILVRQTTLATGSSTITVSAFTLSSSRAVGAVLTLEDRLMAAFDKGSTADLTDAEIAQDTDGDGMTDLNEVLAENDPAGYFGDELFKADVLDVSADSVTVRFACVQGETYTILRATEVGGVVKEVGELTAGQTGYANFTDEDPADGNAFYHILQN